MSTVVHPPTAVAEITEDPHIETPENPAAAKRGTRTWVVMIVAALGVAGVWRVLSGFGGGDPADSDMTYTIVERSFPVVEEVKGELKAAKTTEIKSKVEGRATIIWLIDEGTTVEEGDLLVKLASDRIEEKVRQEEATEASAIAGLEAAEKDLEILIDENASNIRKAELASEVSEIDREKYVKGDAKKALVDIELQLARANQMRDRMLLDYDAAKVLREKEFITKSELLGDEFALHEAERDIEKAELALSIFNTYEYPKETRRLDSDVEEAGKELVRVRKSASAKESQKHADVEAKRANLLNTQNQLKKYREQLGFCEMRAPSPGLVVYHSGNRWDPQKITEGGEVHERQTIVTLPDPSVILVTVRIHEAKTYKIKIGQLVNVEIDAIPGRMFTGKISKIAPLADSRNTWLNPDLKEYETEITLDQNDPELKPGVTARAEIVITYLENVVCAPLQAVYAKGGKHYVFRDEGRDGEPIEVELGEANTEFVEIVSGLKCGERVLLSVDERARAKLPDAEPDAELAAGPPGENKPAQTRKGDRGDRRKNRRASTGGSP